jgi:hypothetical protein
VSATTGLALWWAEHRDVPRATLVDVAAGMLVRGLGLASTDDAKD